MTGSMVVTFEVPTRLAVKGENGDRRGAVPILCPRFSQAMRKMAHSTVLKRLRTVRGRIVMPFSGIALTPTSTPVKTLR